MVKLLASAGLRGLLAILLLASLCDLSLAQGTPPATPATLRAFELDIQAPTELKELLQRHLELLRYRELTDLSDSELARLLTSAQQDTREMAATLGFFSPDIRAEQHATPEGRAARRVTLTVVPGEPTLVREVHIQFTGAMASDGAAMAQRQQIQANWALRSGMRFTQAGWDNAKLQALRQMTAQRYPAGQLTDTLVDIDPEDHSAGSRSRWPRARPTDSGR